MNGGGSEAVRYASADRGDAYLSESAFREIQRSRLTRSASSL